VTKSRAERIAEALKPQISQQIQLERAKFRNTSTGPKISHSLRVIRELSRANGFRPECNVQQRPTIGVDSEYNYYDPSPQERWNPVFKHKLILGVKQEAKKNKKTKAAQLIQQIRGEQSNGAKQQVLPPDYAPPATQSGQQQKQQRNAQTGRLVDPNSVDPNTQQQVDPETGELVDPNGQQQQIDPQTGQPIDDPNAQEQEPPEKPRDPRKDPNWAGNQPIEVPGEHPTVTQKVASRYDMNLDPLRSRVKPQSDFDRRRRLRSPQSNSFTGRHGPTQKYWG
jgi:hypothetical protein